MEPHNTPVRARRRPMAQDPAPPRPDAPGAPTAGLVVAAGGVLAHLDVLGEQVRTYLDAARSANTRRAYAADWRHFTAWCADRGLAALPALPSTLTLYLTDQVGA